MYQTFMELAKDSYSTKLESSTGVKWWRIQNIFHG
jgi:hypothetical protein